MVLRQRQHRARRLGIPLAQTNLDPECVTGPRCPVHTRSNLTQRANQISTQHFRDRSTHSTADRSQHNALSNLPGLKRSGSNEFLASLGGLIRTGTGMSRGGACDKFLTFTGVGFASDQYLRVGSDREEARAAPPQAVHPLARAAKTPVQGQFPLLLETESLETVRALLEQRRLDAKLSRGDGLPGKIWQNKTESWHVLAHLWQDPEYPQVCALKLHTQTHTHTHNLSLTD